MIQAPFTWWSSVLLYCHPRGGEKKRKKKLFPSLIIFTEEQHFVQTVQFCVCVPIIIIIRCISILQVLQACVQDEKKKIYIHVSNGDASYTAPKYKYKTPKH